VFCIKHFQELPVQGVSTDRTDREFFTLTANITIGIIRLINTYDLRGLVIKGQSNVIIDNKDLSAAGISHLSPEQRKAH
jgi:hypothetical protein